MRAAGFHLVVENVITPAVIFARRVFVIAAIYGFLAVPSLYLTDAPDPHRLMYFAFAGIALVFQGVLLVIARDPVQYVALMPLCVFEKLSFVVPALAFALSGQTDPMTGSGGAIDLVFAVLFFIAWRKLARST